MAAREIFLVITSLALMFHSPVYGIKAVGGRLYCNVDVAVWGGIALQAPVVSFLNLTREPDVAPFVCS